MAQSPALACASSAGNRMLRLQPYLACCKMYAREDCRITAADGLSNDIDNKPGPYFGARVRLTGRPVVFAKNNTKQNLITQMTQPVRRRYDVLLERTKKSDGFGVSLSGR